MARVSRLLRRPEDADDVAQEAIARLLTAQQHGQVVHNAQAFAMRTAVRVAIDHRRRLNGHAHPLGDGESQLAAAADALPQPEDVRRLYEAVAALPAKQAAVITLRKLLEWDYAEVAAVLEISQECCRTHCKLGLRRLRELLADEE